MAIAFGAAGTQGAAASGTSITPALPAGLAVGNLIVGMVATKNNATHTWPAGWNKVSQTNSGASWTVSWAWRINVSGVAAPAVSWTGSVANTGQLWSYTGQDQFSPIGVVGTAATGTVSPHTSTSITTTRNNSFAIYIDACSANTVLTQPTGYTQNFGTGSATSVTALASGSKSVATQGTATGAISTAGGAAAWVQIQIEIFAPFAPYADATVSGQQTPPHLISGTPDKMDRFWSHSPMSGPWIPTLMPIAGDWVLVPGPPPIDQTWTWSYNLNLIGKDKLPTGQYPDWTVQDLAPGQRPPEQIQLHSWTWFYNLNLIGQDQLPTGKAVTDLPPRDHSRLFQTWIQSTNLALTSVAQFPANQYDWPNPTQPARLDQTWTRSYNLNLIGQDKLPTGQQLWELTPRQLRNQDIINWVQATNIALLAQPILLPPGTRGLNYQRTVDRVLGPADLYTITAGGGTKPPFVPPGPTGIFTVSGPDVACNFGVSGPPYTRFGYSNVVYPQSPLSLRTK
jgi:hypothetical protein